MTTPEQFQSWARTEAWLREAKASVPAELAANFLAHLEQFDEFLAHNELGLAFDWLYSFVEEEDCASPALIRPLLEAAKEMRLEPQYQLLADRLASSQE